MLTLKEYHVSHRSIYTCPAPCASVYQLSDSSKLRVCMEGFCTEIQRKGVRHVLVLLTEREVLHYYKRSLIRSYEALGLSVTHYPIVDGGTPNSMKSFN